MQKRIAIIGAGNVATHLAAALARANRVVQVVSRTGDSAARLAATIGCPSGTLGGLTAEADVYLVAANDDAIAHIAANTPGHPGIWAHTSGSVDAAVFAPYKERYGVFYPLQTFSRDVEVDFALVPMFVEGNTDEVCHSLMQLAATVSATVEPCDSQKRAALHLAAVFACNFANQMWVEADRILQHSNLSIQYLLPLLQGTLNKLRCATPLEAMTGPARRGDLQTISRHLERLHEPQRDIYRLITDRILAEFGKPTITP